VTERVSIPTVGIGAGPHCDGQIQVLHDILGMFGAFVPKHTKQYAKLGDSIILTITQYRNEVEAGTFPEDKHSAHLSEDIIDSIRAGS